MSLIRSFTFFITLAMVGCGSFHKPIEGISLQGKSFGGLAVGDLGLDQHGDSTFIEGSISGGDDPHENRSGGVLVRVVSIEGTTTEINGCFSSTTSRYGSRLRRGHTHGERNFHIELPFLPTRDHTVEVTPRFPAPDCKR